MHRKAKSHNSIFGIAWNSVLALMVVLLVLLVVVPFIVFTAQPAHAQNSVPATARQAATMPQFASRLAHPIASQQPVAAHHPAVECPMPSLGRSKNNSLLDILYTNGPISGTTDASAINFQFAVSNTFSLSGGTNNLTGMTLGAWLFPGDVLQNVEVLIGTSEFGGTIADHLSRGEWR